MSPERKALLRRGEARALLAVSDRCFRRMLREGRLRRWRLAGGVRAVYLRVEVERARSSVTCGTT